MKPPQTPSQGAPGEPRERRGLTLFLLTLVAFLSYVDRMTLPALAQPIKEEFGLSDTQLGLLTGFAFVAIYAFVGIPMARLADRTGRHTTILALALVFWSLMTTACGLARSYGQLVIARLAVGVGESACQPIGPAILANTFPPERRAFAMGCFLLGNSLGLMAGFALGGWIGSKYGWRTAFIVVGLPGLLVAIAMHFLISSRQTVAVSSNAEELGWRRATRLIANNRAYVWMLVSATLYAMILFSPVSWLVPFFVRSHQLPLSTIGQLVGVGTGVGMACGGLLGGAWADRLVRRGPERPLWLCAGACIVAGILFVAAFWIPSYQLAFAVLFLANTVACLCMPITMATVQNVIDPRLRATAGAVMSMAGSILGIGLGSFVVGVLSDWLQPAFGAESLRYALTALMLMSGLAGAAYWRTSRILRSAAENVGGATIGP